MTESETSAIDWSTALQQHKPWLTKVLRCRIGDRHEVDDLLQDIALAVYRQSTPGVATNRRHHGVPKDPKKVAPWLYRLAVRQAVNFHRRNNRKTKVNSSAELEVSSDTLQPLDWMLAREQSQQLADAISRLKPQQREILTLKYTENWSYQQLSEHLGIPVRSVEYRLHQARKQLRALIVNGVTANSQHSSA